jgi:hypothetical protein
MQAADTNDRLQVVVEIPGQSSAGAGAVALRFRLGDATITSLRTGSDEPGSGSAPPFGLFDEVELSALTFTVEHPASNTVVPASAR